MLKLFTDFAFCLGVMSWLGQCWDHRLVCLSMLGSSGCESFPSACHVSEVKPIELYQDGLSFWQS